jgi:hypothetical protein
MRLLLLDVVVGMLLLAAISAAASRPVRGPGTVGLRTFGWILVCVPLPLAVGLHLVVRLPQTTDQAAFLAGVVAFATGSALILGSSDEDDDWRREDDGDSPSWWPDFERDFHAYATRPPVRRERVRTR